jgi:hypothetical protein
VNGTNGAPGPSWVGSYGYAAYLANVNVEPTNGQPLPFNVFHVNGIEISSTRLRLQNDGLYEVSMAIYNVATPYSITTRVWKNGQELSPVYMAFYSVGPYCVTGTTTVVASAGDYFEIIENEPVTLLGGPNYTVLYYLLILQLA